MATAWAPQHAGAPDAALLECVRAGNRAAFDVLVRRHAAPAWRLALAVTGTIETAVSSVADSFIHVLVNIERTGVVPRSFPLALMAATRRTAVARPAGEHATTPFADDAVAQAFRELPERWRSVLWLTVAEGRDVALAAPVLGLSREATANLVDRARWGWRERYLDVEHRTAERESCRRTIDRLGVDGGLASRNFHLPRCTRCQERAAVVSDDHTALRRLQMPVPLTLGAAAAARWEAWREHQAAQHPPRLRAGALTPPAWAEKVVAGAAAAVLTLGIVGVGLLGGRDRSGRPEVAAPAQIRGPAGGEGSRARVAQSRVPTTTKPASALSPSSGLAHIASSSAADRRAITAAGSTAQTSATAAPSASPATPGAGGQPGGGATGTPVGSNPGSGTGDGSGGDLTLPESGLQDLEVPQLPLLPDTEELLEPVTDPLTGILPPPEDLCVDVVIPDVGCVDDGLGGLLPPLDTGVDDGLGGLGL